jgi:predicted ferric reductase
MAEPHLWHFVAPHNDAAHGDKIDAKAEDESESQITIYEVCTDFQKKMAVCDESIMVGLLLTAAIPVVSFCAPQAMTKLLCK